MEKFKAFVKGVKRNLDARAKANDHFDKAGDPKNPNASKDLRRAVKYHNVVNKEETNVDEAGLWDNIHAKRKRIANGSGEKMRKPGSKGAPTDANFKAASANESVVPDRMKGKQKPYVSSDGKGGHEVLGNTGQVKATFSQKEHGKNAKLMAVTHLQKHYDTYMKEDLKADFKALRAMIEEASYKVDVEGLPTMYVQSDSPTEVKSNLRKILKKADMIRSVDRIPDAEVKKAFRLKAMGKDEE